MNGQSFDINKLPATDGYLIFPLSMSRLQGGQSPEECYSVIERFEGKINQIDISNFPKGIYTLVITTNNNNIIKRIIKPQVNFEGKMIQAAKVTVAFNE